MPGPTIQWTPIDTTEVLSEIREEGRYRLASPSAVKGAPSLAMQATGQNCTVKVYIGGVYRSDALLTVPSTAPVAIRNAVGQPLTGQEMFDMVIEVGNLGFGSVLLTTDEPNGSPSAPFATEAERTAWATANLATLLPGRTTVWGPGNVEYVWNGPLATDWQGIRGPYLGSAENPFATESARDAVTGTDGSIVWHRLADGVTKATAIWKGRWIPVPPVFAQSSGLAGLLGDSIAYQGSSCVMQAALGLGFKIVYNGAVGGQKIEDMTAKIPALVASGADTVFIEIGTNNTADPQALFYPKYWALLSGILAAGIRPIISILPPMNSSANSIALARLNSAIISVCEALGIQDVYDPWSQFAVSSGGWNGDTINSDGTHPVVSLRNTAAATMLSQIAAKNRLRLLARTQYDGMLLNPVFAGSGLTANWTQFGSPASMAFSTEADGANGHQWQVVTGTNPPAGAQGKIYQTITTGFAVGDKLRLTVKKSLITPDAVDDKCTSFIQLVATNNANTGLAANTDNKVIQVSGESITVLDLTVPVGTTKIWVYLSLDVFGNIPASTVVAKFSRPLLINLTALGLT